ncbi:MAG: transglutaminase domain-containing protein [Kofleriaceae bacterium]|nr:transglutaminase domain-containing protein [Kofleriaceae bacterium]
MRSMLPLAFLFAASCASTSNSGLDDIDIDVMWEEEPVLASSGPEATHGRRASAAPVLQTNFYHLTWQGQRIGEAKEVFHRSANGIRLIRSEEIRITRSGVPVDIETEIVIHADSQLRATRVELNSRAGAVERKGRAIRADDGSWVISLDGESVRKAPANAVPLELVPYLVAQQGTHSFKSKVLLAGYGFAVTDMYVDRKGRTGKAVLKTKWGDIETHLNMKGNGDLVSTETGATGSVRVNGDRFNENFNRAELPESSTIPVRGRGSELLVSNVFRQPPPALLGQSVSLRKNGWRIQFDAKSQDVSRQIRKLAREVDSLLSDSHDAPGAGGHDALSLGRGDCTAHATLFVDMATELGIETKLVTGYRIDDNKLVRHRWVVVKQGTKWIQVDPTFGEAPVKPGHHLALAIHGDSTAQIAIVDEAVFLGLAKARARWTTDAI